MVSCQLGDLRCWAGESHFINLDPDAAHPIKKVVLNKHANYVIYFFNFLSIVNSYDNVFLTSLMTLGNETRRYHIILKNRAGSKL